jgi:16S rRNA (uracil1498-N3)-methyltransferase
MQLFYNPNINPDDSSFIFDKEESKHIVKVLRKKTSDILFVTNGLGFLYKTEITSENDSKCIVKIISVEKQNKPDYKIHLAVAPTKMNERYEWFLEKATEIGIHEITPIICENSERTIIKTERFQKIIESAMKQSAQCYLPILNTPISFKEFIKKSFNVQKFIAHCDETNKKSFKNELEINKDVLVLIGPEGDFSKKEIQLAFDNKFIPVTLGNTRLRTETAAVVTCHSIVFKNEE